MTGDLFDYRSVTADTVGAACDETLRRCDALIDALAAAGSRSFANTLMPLEEIGDLLGQAGGRYGFLAHVTPDPEVRRAALANEERLDRYAAALGFREEIDRALRDFAGTLEGQSLSGDAARLLERSLRDFRRSGMHLPAERRARIQTLQERLVTLGIEFRHNIDDVDDALLLTREQLAGLPEAYIQRLRTEEGPDGRRYRVSLDYPELHPFLDSADDRDLREALFRKNRNRAAEPNLPLLDEAIAARDEIATTLGYPSWADYVLEIRVAKTSQAALKFLTDLEPRVHIKADQDLQLLRDTGAAATVAAWDWRYDTQRVLRERYHVDPFQVAEHFPLEAVLDGLFSVYQTLVGVRFLPRAQANAWDPDVRLFDIVDAANDRLVAHFYADLYPRPNKYGHAAAFTLRGGRRLPDGSYQRPVSAIVANFTKPGPDSPSLLRHSEVLTLFHEFGHILHQTLTQSRYLRFAGTQVERDFVEAPSQMLEHWCWSPTVLASFSRHYRSGDPLPADLVQRMVAARNVSSGLATLRQIYFARLDLAYHGPGARKDTDGIARDLHPITALPFPEDTHFQAGFGHLFGYDAGYYGYLWSRVYGDDMFTRFQRAGLDDHDVGLAYRRLILEPGGSRDGDALVRDFLGREPTPDAFLHHLGLTD